MNIGRVILYLLFLQLNLVDAFAAKRTLNDASEIATSFLTGSPSFMQKTPSYQRTVSLAYVSEYVSVNSTNPYYYVFNIDHENGFIIISGDDRAKSVLGYADNGSFNVDELPSNLKNWLDFYELELKQLSETPENTSLQNINFNTLSSKITTSQTTAATITPLLGTLKWNQSSPYNTLCPVINSPNSGSKAATGCVATAMAQLMKYYNWPVQGKGTNSYTSSTRSIPLSVDFSTTTYDWANMTATYSVTSTQAQIDAVATLMYHCGVAVNMDYDVSSGSSATAMAKALVNNFSYDANLQQNMRDYYTRNEWINLLKSELNASRPVIYTGSSSSAGHMFICDGYDNNGLFHFNWGWGGASNGYFEITALNPGIIGTGGGNSGGFNSNQSIITGIQKPNALSSPSYLIQAGSSLESTVSSISRTGTFGISIKDFYNFGLNTFTGEIGLALYNGNVLVEIIKRGNITLNSGWGWEQLSFSNLFIPGKVTEGVYNLYAIYKPTNITEWQIVRGKVGTPNFLKTTIKTTEVIFEVDNNLYPQLTLNSINVIGNLYQNKTGTVNLKITNNGGELNSNLKVTFQSLTNPDSLYNLVISQVNISNGETKEFNLSGIVLPTPGNYHMFVSSNIYNNTNSNDYQVFGDTINVTILAEPTGSPILTLGSKITFPNASNVLKNNIKLTAQLKNTGAYFENHVIAFIYPKSGGNSIGYIGRQIAIIDKNETKTFVFNGETSLALGDYQIGVYYLNSLNSWVRFIPNDFSLIPFKLVDEPTSTGKIYSTSLKIFPNPVNDILHLTASDKIETVKIMDLIGKQLLIINLDTNNDISIPVKHLSKGTYLLHIKLNESIQVIKFIKN